MKTSSNPKIKALVTEIDVLKNRIEEKYKQEAIDAIQKLNSVEFQRFTYDNPYTGGVQNKIFLSYSDHYKANSGEYMSVGTLHHPHINYDDRGYIKGIALDLHNFCLLRSAIQNRIPRSHYDWIKTPKFRKSKNSEVFKQQAQEVKESFLAYIDQRNAALETLINWYSRRLTGLTVKYYLGNI